MSIELKIHEGTGKLTGRSLCETCASGQVWTDATGEHTVCHRMYGLNMRAHQPLGRVTECSVYYNKMLPSLRDLELSAWTLRTEKNGRQIGFEPPKTNLDGSPR